MNQKQDLEYILNWSVEMFDVFCDVNMDMTHFLQALPLPANFPSPTAETKPVSATVMVSAASQSSKSVGTVSELEFGESTELRGSLDWAPPRAQLILKVHPKTR